MAPVKELAERTERTAHLAGDRHVSFSAST